MSILVPSLQKLNFQDTDDETVLPFEDFIKFLRQNLTDRDKNIRVDNIKVELSNKNELRKIAGKIFVTFQGIIVYTASHINDYAICKCSFQDICNILCGKSSTPICSTLLFTTGSRSHDFLVITFCGERERYAAVYHDTFVLLIRTVGCHSLVH